MTSNIQVAMEHLQQKDLERPPEDSDDDLMEFDQASVEEAEDRVLYEYRNKGSFLSALEIQHATRDVDKRNLNPNLLSAVSTKTVNAKNMRFVPLGHSVAHAHMNRNPYGSKALGLSEISQKKEPKRNDAPSAKNEETPSDKKNTTGGFSQMVADRSQMLGSHITVESNSNQNSNQTPAQSLRDIGAVLKD